MKKISILGMGRWASCIAYILNKSKFKVTMWERGTNGGSQLFKTRTNQYLTLPKTIKFTHDLDKAVAEAEVIVIAIYSQNLDDLMNQLKKVKGYQSKHYCIAMKGVEASTGRRLSRIMIDAGVLRDKIAVWAGPGHVQSISTGGATNMVISAYEEAYAKELAATFSNDCVRISTCGDIVGIEFCSACKNVYGIAAGILQAKEMYSHCIGSLMVASLKEMSGFIDAFGGDPKTASSLALLGDYQATMFDSFSKNLSYGKSIVEKNTRDANILKEYIDVNSVEGIKTAQAIIKLKEEYNFGVSDSLRLKMDIAQVVCDVVCGKVKLKDAPDILFKTISEVISQ